MTGFASKLASSIHSKNSLVCCGLDPDITKIPASLTETLPIEEAFLAFSKKIVEITAPYICAYKIQKAFFERFECGQKLLRSVIAFIRSVDPSVPVIIDCKVGDIENTMAAYFEYFFSICAADAVVLNPYMGTDVWRGLEEYPGKAGLVLVRTSNPTGRIVQDVVMHDGQPMWRHVLQHIVEQWNAGGNLIPILSDHGMQELTTIRTVVPDEMPIFLAGVGSQGRSVSGLSAVLDSRGAGVAVNSSRALLYPCDRHELQWERMVREAVIRFRELLNEARA